MKLCRGARFLYTYDISRADIHDGEEQISRSVESFTAEQAEDALDDAYEQPTDGLSAEHEHVQEVADSVDAQPSTERNEEPDTSPYDREAEDAAPTDDEGPAVEYGTELTAEEAVEGLDADDIHRSADAEDGGDYTDYAENVEDDDEQYGEALPEELGGNAEEVAEPNGNQTDFNQDTTIALESTATEPAADFLGTFIYACTSLQC